MQVIIATDFQYTFAIINWHSLFPVINKEGRQVVLSGHTKPDGGFQPLTPKPKHREILPLFSTGSPTTKPAECIAKRKDMDTRFTTLFKCPCSEQMAKINFQLVHSAASSTEEYKCYHGKFYIGGIKTVCCYNEGGYFMPTMEPVIEAGQPGDAARAVKAIRDLCCANNPYVCLMYKEEMDKCSISSGLEIANGGGYGSLHVVNQYGHRLTYNGWGEFILFKNGHIELQGRTQQRGDMNTTYFSALALRTEANSARYQIYITNAGSLEHGWTTGAQVATENFIVDTSVTDSVMITAPNIRLKVDRSVGNSLAFTLWVPQRSNYEEYQGMLCENRTSSTEKWKVANESLSLFDYKKPTVTTFVAVNDHEEFEPHDFPLNPQDIVIENVETMSQMTELCGDNLFCRQEFVLFGNHSAASTEIGRDENLSELLTLIHEHPPKFVSTWDKEDFNASQINAGLSFQFSVEDAANVTFFASGGDIAQWFSFEGNTALFTGNVSVLRNLTFPQQLAFYAKNTDNHMIAEFRPPMTLCLCEDDSQCSVKSGSPYLKDSIDNTGNLITDKDNVFITPCFCFGHGNSNGKKKSGRYCNLEVDICDNCYDASLCNKADNNSHGYSCGQCPSNMTSVGFNTIRGIYCIDRDFCLQNNGRCPQVCTSASDAASCSCNSGFESKDDGRICEDIDECKVGNYNCSGSRFCVNTIGSYECHCYGNAVGPNCVFASHIYPGKVQLSPIGNQKSLDSKSDAEKTALKAKIENAIKKRLTQGSKALTSTDALFVEVTELRSISNRVKRNAEKGPGVESDFLVRSSDSIDAASITSALSNPKCETNCDLEGLFVYAAPTLQTADACNLPTVNTCDPHTSTCNTTTSNFVSCQCLPGFTQTDDPDVCIDIDECTQATHNCPTNITCVNTFGSYTCDCGDYLYWNSLSGVCEAEPCIASNCPGALSCLYVQGEKSYKCASPDEMYADDDDDDDDGWKIATIVVSCVLGVICVALIIAVVVLFKKNKAREEQIYDMYTNNRMNDFTTNTSNANKDKYRQHSYDNHAAHDTGNRGNYL